MEQCRANVNLLKLRKHNNKKKVLIFIFLTLPEAAYVFSCYNQS